MFSCSVHPFYLCVTYHALLTVQGPRVRGKVCSCLIFALYWLCDRRDVIVSQARLNHVEARVTQQIHTILLLKHGIDQVYVMLDFIRNRFVKLWSTQNKRESQNQNLLLTVGLAPTTPHLLDWHSIQLRHGTTLIVKLLIWIYVATRGQLKYDKLLEHALQCKTIIKHQNIFDLLLTIVAKTEVPRDVRNSKVRKQDKFRRDWSQHENICKYQRRTGPGVRRSKRPLLAYRTRCKCSMETSGN